MTGVHKTPVILGAYSSQDPEPISQRVISIYEDHLMLYISHKVYYNPLLNITLI